MEKNITTFETGATSSAVNELILYTDNTPELVAIRNSIYMVMQAVPEVSLRPLLSRAIESYGKEFGRNAGTKHIRLMDHNERDEYCQVYVSRFDKWKKEIEMQAPVGRLVSFTDKNLELTALRDRIYQDCASGEISTYNMHWQFVYDLCKIAQHFYQTEIEEIVLNSKEQNEYATIYTNRFDDWKKERERNPQ